MRLMLHGKIHRAKVTQVNVNYEGSITIDKKLMDAADIFQYEAVHVLNVNTGARIETYAIEGILGVGEIVLNGPAARMFARDDIVMILTYHRVPNSEALLNKPKIVYVDDNNNIK